MELTGNLNESFDIGTGPLVPDTEVMETGRVPLEVYTSPEYFEREREIFGRTWLSLAEAGEIPNAGDWVVREVKIRSASVIIVRGKDMAIRAFHNVCSHRGMKLVWGERGSGGKFSCPYHAWMYDARGALTNVPDAGCFPHLNKSESGLTPISCDIWEGLIFINFQPSPRQSLAEFLGPVVGRLKNLPISQYSLRGRTIIESNANWKLAMESQMEAYHVISLHQKTLGRMLSPADNIFGHPVAVELLGPHRMSTNVGNPEYVVPSDRIVQNFAYRNLVSMPDDDGDLAATPEVHLTNHPDINKVQTNNWQFDQYGIYPNLVFLLGAGNWWLFRFWPTAPDKCDFESVFHFEQPKSLRNRMAIQFALAMNRDTLMEDISATVQQQKIMKSGAKQCAQFGTQEAMLMHSAAVSLAVSRDELVHHLE